MILIDLSQTIIAVAFQNFKGKPSEDLIRAMVFQTLLSYKKKFGSKFGNLILAIDKRGEQSWRKKKYEWYKARRKNKLVDPKEKEKWEMIFRVANTIVQECQDNLTWKTVGVVGAEADDVIAVLGKKFGCIEPTLIVSSDGDFGQLQQYPYVSQWMAAQKKYLKVDDGVKYLHEKILNGDNGDDIPNIMSDSDTFVTEGKRQKPITASIRQQWMSDPTEMKNKYSSRYKENKELIDFECIPTYISDEILSAYYAAPVHSIQKLYKFFVSVRMTRILEDLELFKVKQGSYEQSEQLCSDDDFFDGGIF